MITEKDIKMEYRRDTGCEADSVGSGFDEWLLEKHIELRNLIEKNDKSSKKTH